MPISILICECFLLALLLKRIEDIFFFSDSFILLVTFLKTHPRSSVFPLNITSRRERGEKEHCTLLKECLSTDFKGNNLISWWLRPWWNYFRGSNVKWEPERLSIQFKDQCFGRGLSQVPFHLWYWLSFSPGWDRRLCIALCLCSRELEWMWLFLVMSV